MVFLPAFPLSCDTQHILKLRSSLIGQVTGICMQLSEAITTTTQGIVYWSIETSTEIKNPHIISYPIESRRFTYGMLLTYQQVVQHEFYCLIKKQMSTLSNAYIEVVRFLEDAAWIRFHQKYPTLQMSNYVTKTERQVLIHIQQGLSNAEIATILGIQQPTLKTHKRNLYQKLGAHRESQALAYGKEGGLFLYCS